MITCPVCQFRNPDANDRCFRCSALLKRDETAMQESSSNTRSRMWKMRFSSLFMAPVDYLRHRPWVARLSEVPDDGRYRYPFTAGLLSLVPGAGHWYAGQGMRGALIFIVWLAVFVFAVATIREPWSNYVLFGLLFLWLFVWADSVAVAARGSGDYWIFRKTLALVFGAMMILGVSISVTQYLGIGFIQLERVTANALRPAFSSGDRVLFTSMPLWFRSPRVGEIVTCDPQRMEVLEGRNVYSVNIRKYMQRVIGVPGDRVEKRGNTFYRNGSELTRDQVPLGTAESLPDYNFEVPEDHFFIPVTSVPADAFAGLIGAGGLTHVGQPGYVFTNWPEVSMVPESDIRGKGVVILNPPQNRRWLSD